MNQTNPSSSTTYTGHDVIDEQGTHIGRVVDVIYDEVVAEVDPVTDPLGGAGREPTWLVVDPGVLRSAHYLPAAGTYRTQDGAIVTPWDKEWVKSATKAGGDHILTQEQRDELRSHYTLPE